MAAKSDPWAQTIMRNREHIPFMLFNTLEEIEKILEDPEGEYQVVAHGNDGMAQ